MTALGELVKCWPRAVRRASRVCVTGRSSPTIAVPRGSSPTSIAYPMRSSPRFLKVPRSSSRFLACAVIDLQLASHCHPLTSCGLACRVRSSDDAHVWQILGCTHRCSHPRVAQLVEPLVGVSHAGWQDLSQFLAVPRRRSLPIPCDLHPSSSRFLAAPRGPSPAQPSMYRFASFAVGPRYRACTLPSVVTRRACMSCQILG